MLGLFGEPASFARHLIDWLQPTTKNTCSSLWVKRSADAERFIFLEPTRCGAGGLRTLVGAGFLGASSSQFDDLRTVSSIVGDNQGSGR